MHRTKKALPQRGAPYFLLARGSGVEPLLTVPELSLIYSTPYNRVYYVYRAKYVGGKMSHVSTFSMISTQVAPRLHQIYQTGKAALTPVHLCRSTNCFWYRVTQRDSRSNTLYQANLATRP